MHTYTGLFNCCTCIYCCISSTMPPHNHQNRTEQCTELGLIHKLPPENCHHPHELHGPCSWMTSSSIQHEAYQLSVCSNSEEEFFIGYDEDETWHANFNLKTGILTIPIFSGPMAFAEFYERGLSEVAFCKSNLHMFIADLENPPPEIEAPLTSIYPKDDVQLGVENTLICYATGFYPPSVRVSWNKNNINVTEGMRLSQYRPKKDGTFNIFSTLKFMPAEGDVYSCTVKLADLNVQTQTKIWDVDVEVAFPSVGPVVFCGVAVTVGVVGIVAGIVCFIKGKNYT
ncbi:RLA class II histocompatibility antigen, DP alpha-1 chain-like isoform X2 [Puntigrus tetrazona]|uniref:RLA class II histocompatibility antigen, DP alpha-1 chain-like isoform X2 n=1 Tax=Puntigrus tetrazona TaxID=1606681 RepID=UPI001C8AF3B4|nr:RLA class II histocompatibility antigen, DP alpha-1 chain-like isoform X2 [Puntigrus tetrazona]